MQIEFLGAAHEVTGSCHYVTFGDKHVLVDCGMEQGPDLYVNQEIPVNAAAVDYVFVTHAHIDHSGLLPLLYNHGFRVRFIIRNGMVHRFPGIRSTCQCEYHQNINLHYCTGKL